MLSPTIRSIPVEILDHAARRSARANRPANGHLQTIRVPVHPRALSRMERQHVRRLEAEMLANLRGDLLQFSLRAHRFETPLEIGEETAGHVAVDDAMIEREARVHHAPDRDRVVVAHDELL